MGTNLVSAKPHREETIRVAVGIKRILEEGIGRTHAGVTLSHSIHGHLQCVE